MTSFRRTVAAAFTIDVIGNEARVKTSPARTPSKRTRIAIKRKFQTISISAQLPQFGNCGRNDDTAFFFANRAP
ncbi:hypothetical protein Pla52n_59990 [Stieleria varia]|uniref:Uncharacterized protein n=1 Tax=Stieleria varia TaxID=2528005 RepID=A0A5C6A194_9BACT|nr:hypothetical protein Pla52n_59990 [Stieleria varia]